MDLCGDEITYIKLHGQLALILELKGEKLDWGCRAVIQHLPAMGKALWLMPKAAENGNMLDMVAYGCSHST